MALTPVESGRACPSWELGWEEREGRELFLVWQHQYLIRSSENSGSFSLLCTYKPPLLEEYEKHIIIWCFFSVENVICRNTKDMSVININACFNQVRLGCHSNNGDINPQSFSQIAFFIIAANVLGLLPCAAVSCFAVVCPGQPQHKCQSKSPVILSIPAVLPLQETTSRTFIPHTPLFLNICLFSLLSRPCTLHLKIFWA